ncbi:MAG: hypothetical protein JWP78_2315 [Mucilaginibacter sp.]|nr:hypothetical protein [Mucilaginibacter sp.]
MKPLLVVVGIIAALLLGSLDACRKPTLGTSVAQAVIGQMDIFTQLIENQLLPAAEQGAPTATLRKLFLQARLAYKRNEWAMAYFTPGPDRLINGPPVAEVERTGQVLQPGGLQVIENELFMNDPSKKKQLVNDLRGLLVACAQSRLYFQHVPLLDWQLWEAARMEVFRIETLGISGFDSPLAENNIKEAAMAVDGLHELLTAIGNPAFSSRLNSLFHQSDSYLRSHPDFDSFDRAKFITGFVNPLSHELLRLQEKNRIKVLHYNRLLRQLAASLFDKDAFSPTAFAEDPHEALTQAKIALGERLFHEPLLSGPATRSCASCHQPERAFTDGLAANTVIGTQVPLKRRTPTLLNAALQPAQFADMRVITLEQQVEEVVANPQEMHGSLSMACSRLSNDPSYRRQFATVFRAGILPAQVVSALAAYVRSLSSLDSRFDDFMRGNHKALDRQEIAGFNLFMGKAKCGTCHYMPLFNGALPPLYERMDAEVIGVPGKNKKLDTDPGVYAIVPAAPLRHAFKTPTVRNSTRLAHFMHNGVYDSLSSVLDFYNRGGGGGAGLEVPNQTLTVAPLHLSKKDCADIIAFIGSLDSRQPKLTDHPIKR